MHFEWMKQNNNEMKKKKYRMSEQKQCGQLVAEIQTNAYLIGFFFLSLHLNIYIFRSLNSFMIFFSLVPSFVPTSIAVWRLINVH